MSKLFKNTLLAAAIAGVSSVAAAGTLTGTTVNYSAQGAAAAASTATTTASFTHTVNAGFAINDLITYTVTTGSVNKTAGWPSTISFTAGSGGASMVATLLTNNTDNATYRVTGVTGTTGQTTIGANASVTLTHNVSSFAADVTVDVKAMLSNGVTEIDAGTKTHKIVDSKDQLGDIKVASSAVLNGVIDVAKQRKALTTTNDAFTFTASNDTTLTGAVTVASQTVTLKGDFAGFKDANFVSAGGGVEKYDDTKKELTITYSTPVTTDTVTITPPVTSTTAKTEAVVLNAQSFTVSGVSTFGTTTESLGSAAAGAWTLNGAVVSVPYMPYGDNISQIIYVTNEGTLDADMSVTAIDEAGNMYDLGVIGVSKKGSVTGAAGVIATKLKEAGFSGTGKVALTITVNAQDKDVTVYSAYNVGGSDRGNVLNSQYKGK